MTIYFDLKNTAFYSSNVYDEIPSAAIEISGEKHQELLNALNRGCIIFDDLTFSPPKPSQFHKWNGSTWVDNRTAEEIAEYNRSIMPTLIPMDFDLKLNKFGLYQQVQDLIKTDIELSIAYNRAQYFSRTDPFIEQARQALELTNEQIDKMWMI